MEARKSVKSGEVVTVSVTAAVRELLHEEEEDVVEEERRKEREVMKKLEEEERQFVVHVPLPDEKKMELLNKYVSEGLLEEQSEAKAMLNIQR